MPPHADFLTGFYFPTYHRRGAGGTVRLHRRPRRALIFGTCTHAPRRERRWRDGHPGVHFTPRPPSRRSQDSSKCARDSPLRPSASGCALRSHWPASVRASQTAYGVADGSPLPSPARSVRSDCGPSSSLWRDALDHRPDARLDRIRQRRPSRDQLRQVGIGRHRRCAGCAAFCAAGRCDVRISRRIRHVFKSSMAHFDESPQPSVSTGFAAICPRREHTAALPPTLRITPKHSRHLTMLHCNGTATK